MDTNKMREQFEAAYLAEMKRLYGITGTAENNLAWRRPDGDYVDPMLRLAFWAWRASREVLAVELPSACAYEGLTQHLGSVIELTYEAPEHDPVGLARLPDVRAAIEAHGIKVTP